METKTFIEVHAELEAESTFIKKKHDIGDFKGKADFLTQCGFTNSIATKLYSDIAYRPFDPENYERKYGGIYKFIFESQLERVCEKYDLYVRRVNQFIGDIPEKNIKEMMKFKVYLQDLPIKIPNEAWLNTYEINVIPNSFNPAAGSQINLSNVGKIEAISASRNRVIIQIAAVKKMFSEEAFKESQARIIENEGYEPPPKNKVELDPIVLCKVKGGYLVITAWGDEANDELVVNQNNN
jgi:hypothetical protein